MSRNTAFGASLCLAVLLSSPAYAYVDPGSGTLLIQMLIAAAVGVSFYFRKALFRITSLFGGQSKEKKSSSDQQVESNSDR